MRSHTKLHNGSWGEAIKANPTYLQMSHEQQTGWTSFYGETVLAAAMNSLYSLSLIRVTDSDMGGMKDKHFSRLYQGGSEGFKHICIIIFFCCESPSCDGPSFFFCVCVLSFEMASHYVAWNLWLPGFWLRNARITGMCLQAWLDFSLWEEKFLKY